MERIPNSFQNQVSPYSQPSESQYSPSKPPRVEGVKATIGTDTANEFDSDYLQKFNRVFNLYTDLPQETPRQSLEQRFREKYGTLPKSNVPRLPTKSSEEAKARIGSYKNRASEPEVMPARRRSVANDVEPKIPLEPNNDHTTGCSIQ